jgi:N utilization substance protein B
VQGLYQWQLSGNDMPAIEAHLAEVSGFEKVDRRSSTCCCNGAIADNAAELQAHIAPHLDRPYAELSPVERAILLLATFELKRHQIAPYKVVINEAIELAKDYGGTDGHKYRQRRAGQARRPDAAGRSRAPQIAGNRRRNERKIPLRAPRPDGGGQASEALRRRLVDLLVLALFIGGLVF